MSKKVKIIQRLFILLTFLLKVSCYAHDHYVTYYYRSERKNTYFEKRYINPIDTVNLSKISLCKRVTTYSKGKLSTKGKLNIKIDRIQENIINSLKNNFDYVNYTHEDNSKWANYCYTQNKKIILSEGYKYNFERTKGHNMLLSFKVECESSRDSFVDGFYGGFEILNNDEHITKLLSAKDR
jgi:hypothetical protein